MKKVSRHTTIKGINTHYVRMGNGPKNIIFLHGWGGSTESFTKKLIPLFLKKNNKYTAYVLDLPGFGTSGYPPLSGWGTKDYAKFVAAFLEHAKIRKGTLYGHSFGCRLVVRILTAISLPLFRTENVILTGAAGIRLPLSLRQKIGQKLSVVFSRAKSLIPRIIQKWVLIYVFRARDWGHVEPTMKETLKKVIAEADIRKVLKTIKTPTLIIWGKRDTVTPVAMRDIYQQSLPNAQLKMIPEGRHGIHHTHTREMVDFMTNFLSS